MTITFTCGVKSCLAQSRVFVDLSLEYVGKYDLPKMKYKDTPVGGLSGITYDRSRDRFYIISDDRGNLAPARFYTMKLDINPKGIKKIQVENVTFLRDKNGKTFAPNTTDTEGIALTPDGTVFISSEGNVEQKVPQFIKQFSIKTGKEVSSLMIPKRYTADGVGEKQKRGIQNNLGFEGLTLSPTGTVAKGEPFRLFTVTESSLVQDIDQDGEKGARSRFLHYLISDNVPVLIAEHLYNLEVPPEGAMYHGVSEILSIDQNGHFLSLERSFGLLGFTIKIYQLTLGGATDTSQILSLKGNINKVKPIKKKLVLDLDKLGITLDNLEGMTLGPRFKDGSKSLILVSDDNFSQDQVTQFLLFKIKGKI